MRIAFIRANIGGIDEVPPLPIQTIDDVDYFVFTENNLPFALPNFDNRTKARYLKIMPHRYLSGYDAYIWLDGRVDVTSVKFIETFREMLYGKDFVATLHGYRDNLYDELKFILHEMNKGNHYLISRYGHQQLRKELDLLYKEDFPKEFPLFSSGMFMRKNNDKVNKMCEDWFFKCLEYTNFDQVMLSYCMKKHAIDFNALSYDNELYKVLKHKAHDPY